MCAGLTPALKSCSEIFSHIVKDTCIHQLQFKSEASPQNFTGAYT